MKSSHIAPPGNDRPLSGLAVGLARVVRELGLTAVARVAAHAGHPWTELADRVAKQRPRAKKQGSPDMNGCMNWHVILSKLSGGGQNAVK